MVSEIEVIRQPHSAFLEEKVSEIEVIRQPDSAFLEEKGVFEWETWECGVYSFPFTYEKNACCYMLKGRVTITPTDGRKAVTFGKGDFVYLPKGMSCTWDVLEPLKKHFRAL
jgi:uncharacterized cupin superfamily protein